MHPIDINVGKKIRYRRWMLGMTQFELASRIGVKFQQVQKYETAANRISASRLWETAQALEVPVEFFFSSKDDNVATPTSKVDESFSRSLNLTDERKIDDLTSTHSGH